MSNVDAVRMLADEHHLEFVDLERFNVDASVSTVVPVAVARKHHVVPIGRRFGAPVVATSNPADVVAMDDLRAVIGREFVAVVASDEQIDACLTVVYGEREKRKDTSAGSKQRTQADSKNGSSPQVNGQSVASASAPPIETEPRSAPPPPPPPPMPPLPPLPPLAPAAPAPTATPATPATPAEKAPTAAPVPSEPGPANTSVPRTARSEADEVRPERPEDVLAAALEAIDTSLGASTVTAPSPAPVEPAAQGAVESTDLVVTDSPQTEATPEPKPPAGPGPNQVADVVLAADLVDQVVGEFEQNIEVSETDGVPEGLAGFPPLARVLVEGERVSLEDMTDVLEERERTGQAIARILTLRGLVTEADLMWGMAQEMGLEFVDLEVQTVDFAAAYHLPEATARHHNVLVMGLRDGVPVVAASNPTDVFAMDDLRTIIGRNFVTVVATRSQITAFIDKAYHQGGDASEVATAAASDFEDMGDEDLGNIQAIVDDAPIVRYVNLLVLQALNERASDIHVEPTGENLRIRYRIDGVLHDISTAPRAIASAVTTRLKVMADINIAEHRLPQDGRISLTVGNRPIDLRMATLPTIYGEKVVMRVLDKSNVVLGFEDLGFDPDLLEIYEKIYHRPYGTILVTGPTGSGKTTTLYATLAALNNPEKNIITVEDPVELRIKGINQVQLNVKAGLTFASALRSILRSDPDIVLVGEIRDRETAMISVEAALTGHLVLATLHTNDSASTPMRLVEMGLEPYLVTSAVTGALAQRLARRLCTHCREPFDATEADIVAAGWRPDEVYADADKPTLFRAVGCSACSNTGYRGRKALLELLVVTEDVERLIIEGGTADDIHKLAVEQGMVTLRRSGIRKALEGETTLEEVLRVVA
ncbi:MAG: ATPase, T2SS/T4P/T4SS family [Acidimicrobiales bacterium]|nr:ATPase, T2SS/T4P/T4SS family [Acidimicrobiales bacterium]